MTLYCRKCDVLMHYLEFMALPNVLQCPKCGIEIYEVSDY